MAVRVVFIRGCCVVRWDCVGCECWLWEVVIDGYRARWAMTGEGFVHRMDKSYGVSGVFHPMYILYAM